MSVSAASLRQRQENVLQCLTILPSQIGYDTLRIIHRTDCAIEQSSVNVKNLTTHHVQVRMLVLVIWSAVKKKQVTCAWFPALGRALEVETCLPTAFSLRHLHVWLGRTQSRKSLISTAHSFSCTLKVWERYASLSTYRNSK